VRAAITDAADVPAVADPRSPPEIIAEDAARSEAVELIATLSSAIAGLVAVAFFQHQFHGKRRTDLIGHLHMEGEHVAQAGLRGDAHLVDAQVAQGELAAQRDGMDWHFRGFGLLGRLVSFDAAGLPPVASLACVINVSRFQLARAWRLFQLNPLTQSPGRVHSAPQRLRTAPAPDRAPRCSPTSRWRP